MTNHPNRSKRWTRDGDQFVWTGMLGEYRITEWTVKGVNVFAVSFKPKVGSKKSLGEFSTFTNAGWAAENYDNYHAEG